MPESAVFLWGFLAGVVLTYVVLRPVLVQTALLMQLVRAELTRSLIAKGKESGKSTVTSNH